ncbi:PHP domain-containing protein [Labilibaculum sp. DW002]|uniref:PHP domain-containing protein n=1 Tax=Paralabilibaculum antarcticum TaxID=2912572 RepID=A0ABT5VU18_9BACT|nr:PHP domain-containing protein [Labilibaculum sp. DW002]MDE5418915.1 PHP domain-containing protein [Labilibaculum sp. DW002]
MKTFRVDLHTHTVLSPCGDLEMSPVNIVEKAKERGIDVLGISDHNSTLHAPLIKKLAAKENIEIMMGAEVTTKEEVHCLCFFETEEKLVVFQKYLDKHLPHIANDSDKFGYQVVVNEEEEILNEVEWLLISGINQSIDQLEKKVHELDGLFIPAHVNKMQDSIISQLGFIPIDLNVDALEISQHTTKSEFLKKNKYLKNYNFIRSSDAHYIDNIGNTWTNFFMERRNFEEIKMALAGIEGRKIEIK